jgi:hypothetical protein
MQSHNQSDNEWGAGGETHIILQDKKHAQERFNRRLDLSVALIYFLIIFGVYWLGGITAKDILSFITPVVFYLLGMNSSKSK